jgi:hypothetical protein
VKGVIQSMNEYRYQNPDQYRGAELLLSINRSGTLEKAEETIKLAAQYHGQGVVCIVVICLLY